MGKKRSRIGRENVELSMTPMIDVVFQLLIYFVVTMKVPEVPSHLDVNRPSAGRPPPGVTEPPKMLQIEIYPGAYMMNGKPVDLTGLSDVLGRLAQLSKTQTVMIKCSIESEHSELVNVLDRCAKEGLSNLNVISMQ